MDIEQQIDALATKIHEDDIFGVFIEMGCAATVANSLMSVAGSSKTIFMAQQPYSKDYQEYQYGNTDERAVSKENVQKILKHHDVEIFNQSQDCYGVNSFFVSSFQIGDETNKVSTHGWIAYQYNDNLKFYHISIHEPLTRKEYLQRIALCGLSIIASKNQEAPKDCYIDIISGNPLDKELIDDLLVGLNSIGDQEQFLCVRDGRLCRLEDFFRDQENILIMKGSFNPMHDGHREIAEGMKDKYGALPKLMISLETVDKGRVGIEEVKRRILDLNRLGYDVMISKSGYFKDCIDYIRQKFKQQIVFGLGMDTSTRLFQSSYPILDQNGKYTNKPTSDILTSFSYDFKNVKLFVANRDGYGIPEILLNLSQISGHLELHEIENSHLSSTKIRNNEI